MKTQVCANCGNDIKATDKNGNRSCPVCGSMDFEEVEIPNETHCYMCGKVIHYDEKKGAWVTEKGVKPPFMHYSTKPDGTEINYFYCGRRGWD
jgi:NMD protein affecting ribosome stability and mRNA decay